MQNSICLMGNKAGFQFVRSQLVCVSSDSLIMIVMVFSMEMAGYDNLVHMVHMIIKKKEKSPARSCSRRGEQHNFAYSGR